jgi:hypothetical protein
MNILIQQRHQRKFIHHLNFTLMNKTMKVLFLLRTRANYEGGPAPIYMRVTIEGERFEFATQRKADPEKWDSKAGRLVKSKKEETRQLNNYLDMLQMKVFEAHRELLTIGEDHREKGQKFFARHRDR